MKIPDNIADELVQHGSFCYWRYENRNGKRTKIPYSPNTGEPARSNDKSTFCRFDELKANDLYSGIGIGIFDGICAIDMDDCITQSGSLTELSADVVTIMHGYTERSPSGKGIHIFFRANDFQFDAQTYYIMNHRIGMEIYIAGATSKYVTITGNPSGKYRDFGDRTHELQLVLDKYMRRPEKEPVPGNAGINGVNGTKASEQQESLSDEEIISRLSRLDLWKGDWSRYPSQSEADMALCSHLAFWTGRNAIQIDRLFRCSRLMRDKWDRVQSGSTYGAITTSKAISMCAETYCRTSPDPCDSESSAESAHDVSEFPPLIPLEQECAQLSSFPVDALPMAVGDYVKAVAENTQTAIDMAASIAIGVMAACLQGKYVIQPKPGYQEPLNMYIMVIASPGERKSSVLREMTAPVYDYEKECNEKMADAIRENQLERETLERKIEGLTMKLKRRENEETAQELNELKRQLQALPMLQPPRYVADDCTCEALTSLMAANHGSLSVISSEGGIFDILTGRYSDKVNIDTWLKGHSGDTIRVDRLGRATDFIARPALSAILTVQPSVLSNIMENSTLDGRGLLARFMYCTPPSRIGCRSFITPPMPDAVKVAYDNLAYKLMSLPRQAEPIVLTLSVEALNEMEQYFLKHERFLAGDGQDMIEWASKYIGAVLRIAGLIHVTDAHQDDEVQLETLRRAIAIGEYFLEQSRYAFSLMGVDEAVRKAKFVVNRIRQEKIVQIKRCELFRLCRSKYFKKVEDILQTLELLENNGFIRQVPSEQTMTKGRKPDVVIQVNPLVLSAA